MLSYEMLIYLSTVGLINKEESAQGFRRFEIAARSKTIKFCSREVWFLQ